MIYKTLLIISNISNSPIVEMYFFNLCVVGMSVLRGGECACCVLGWSWRPEKGGGSIELDPWTYKGLWVIKCGFQELNSGPLQEQKVLLTILPSLHPQHNLTLTRYTDILYFIHSFHFNEFILHTEICKCLDFSGKVM